MNGRPNPVQLFNILMACQAFAGKPLKCLDHADNAFLPETLESMAAGLTWMAQRMREEDKEDWPELHKLADQIEKALK